ncbi:MAG: chemotaxis protein CheA [Oscillospiraceae bacterium]|nr:chemotaxis protein CheA [Oscillospiraceae bacterium]
MSNLSANDQMMEMFLFEMNTLLEQLDEVLLTSEKSGSLTEENIGEVFRIMHTIKGSSAMMDFTVIASVTHHLEDTFFYIRDNGIDQSHFTRLFDLMLDATDFLKSQLEAIQSGGDLAEGNDDLMNRTKDLYDAISGKAAPAAAPAAAQDVAAPAQTGSPTGEGTVYDVEIMLEEDCGMENLRAFMIVEGMRKFANILSYSPPDMETDPDTTSYIIVNGFQVIAEVDMDPDTFGDTIEQMNYVSSATVHLVEMEEERPVITGECYEVTALFEADCGMENLRAFMLLNNLRSTCNILYYFPEDIETNTASSEEIVKDGFRFMVETAQTPKRLEELILSSMHVASAKITDAEKSHEDTPELSMQDTPSPAAQQPAVQQHEQPGSPAAVKAPAAAVHKPIRQNLINVSLSKLDELMDLMGELVITESMVTRSPDLQEIPHLDNFNKSARQLRKLTDELQDMVMSIRMVPVSGTFQKMQRVVRDMSRSLGKEADLVTMGEETDIDKTIVDAISDPIMHLVRNCMDHGVETPDERAAAGKSPKATVALSAQNTGGEILITVSDDGKGLDAEKLLQKAAATGILTKPAGEYTEREAFQLLMAPGFSTKEEVTEYSGRGVGMDVVKKNIEKIGGTVLVESKKGQGMSVFLKIPLTLAIVDGMNISVGNSVYTLQITAISQSFKATKEQVILDTDGNEMIMIRGEVYPIIRIHNLYGIYDGITDIEEGILILVQSGEQAACLFVDQLLGMQQIVVKPLPVYLNRYDIKPYGISGCTILGDGNISLILDVGSIIDLVM